MLQRQRPDLGVEDLKIERVHRGLRRPATHADGLCQQLRLPFRGLGGRHAKLCGQLRQRLLTLARGERYLCLEGRPMIASRSLHRIAPWGVGEQGDHVPHCPNFRVPLSPEVFRNNSVITGNIRCSQTRVFRESCEKDMRLLPFRPSACTKIHGAYG